MSSCDALCEDERCGLVGSIVGRGCRGQCAATGGPRRTCHESDLHLLKALVALCQVPKRSLCESRRALPRSARLQLAWMGNVIRFCDCVNDCVHMCTAARARRELAWPPCLSNGTLWWGHTPVGHMRWSAFARGRVGCVAFSKQTKQCCVTT